MDNMSCILVNRVFFTPEAMPLMSGRYPVLLRASVTALLRLRKSLAMMSPCPSSTLPFFFLVSSGFLVESGAGSALGFSLQGTLPLALALPEHWTQSNKQKIL